MLQHIIWAISFFAVWLAIVWLHFVYLGEQKKEKKPYEPTITLSVPAYNEEQTIAKTISSLVKLKYPKEKMQIVVANDGSTDSTAALVRELIKKYKGYNIMLLNKENGGKASALNAVLAVTEGELFAVVDADSRVDKKSLRFVVPHFTDPEIGGTISRIRVDGPKNFLERIQRFEYIMSSMLRKIMAMIGTLAITPGVLSVYRTQLIRKLGGFVKDRTNLTEDLEIALRLKAHGYKIAMEDRSITHTKVPSSVKMVWKQRVRWSRGYIYNLWNYRKMLFSRKHGFYGLFQMPVDILAICTLVLSISLITYAFFSDIFESLWRAVTIKGYFINRLLDFPSWQHLTLGQNLRIIIPIIASFALGITLILIAHRRFNEKVRHNVITGAVYVAMVPYFLAVNWVVSFLYEVFKTKRKW